MSSNLKSNLVYSVLGVIFNTIFPLITYPYVTRTLGVLSLGEYNFYSSTVAYLAIVSGFGISLYGTKELGRYAYDKQKYSLVFGELLTINLIMVGLVYLFIIALMLFGSKYNNTSLFLITSVTILTECIGAEYIFVALERQKFMFVRNVIFKIVSLICIFSFVRNENDLTIYACIMLLSTAGISFTNVFAYRSLVKWKCISISMRKLIVHLKPLFQVFLMNILINYYGKMDVVVLGNIDSVESVGYYSTASKIYSLSYAFLASTAIPLLPRASYYIDQGLKDVYEELIQKCYDIYLIIIVFISFILFYYSDPIVTLIAGNAFAPSSIPLKLFSLTLFFSSVSNCLIFQVFYPHNKSKLVLFSQTVGIVVDIILCIILIPFLSYSGAAIAFFCSYMALFCTMLVLGRSILPKFKGVKDLLKEFSSIVFCICLAITLSHTEIYFLIQFVLCGVVYIICNMLLKNQTLDYLSGIIISKIFHKK